MNMLSLQPPPVLAGAPPRVEDDPPDQPGCEFIDGLWVEKRAMGAQASRVSVVIKGKIDAYAVAHELGFVFDPDAGYQIFPENRVRKPDGSFVRRGRFPDDRLPRGYIKIVPDLILEVVSPNDLAEEINVRVMDFLQAGVPLLWVIYPGTRSVYVFRQGGSMSWLTEADALSGEEVLPGFACRVADLFIGI